MQLHKELVVRSNLREVNALRLPTRHELVVHAAVGDVRRLPAERQDKVRAKERVCQWLLQQEGRGVSRNNAVELLLIKAEVGSDEGVFGVLSRDLAQLACGKKDLPSRSAILQWVADFGKQGQAALVSGHWSRQRRTEDWQALALQIYSAPGQPNAATVARDLRRKHGFTCTNEQVSNYLEALPVHLGKRNSLRLGKHLFKQTETPYVRRSREGLLPGDIYMADGYRADAYIAHPMTGDIWRPELMHVLDVATNKLAGYRVMAHEGSFDVMMGWANIMQTWGHVPVMIYVDNGSGYRNKIASDEVTGYYKRAGVQQVIHSLPKNARGKGNIERYHRVARDDFFKTWKPALYCGPDMAKDALDETVRQFKAGRLQLPSLQEFIADYDAWLRDDYHQRSAPDDKTLTRDQAFAALQPIPPHATALEIARPCEKRVVNRAAVQLHNREYMHPDLIGWNKRPVHVEFDIYDHGHVTVRDLDGYLICDAPLVKTIGIVGDSLLADKRQAALAAAVKRQERHLEETYRRAGAVIDVDATAQAVIDHTPTLRLERTAPTDAPGDDITLDLTDFNNPNPNPTGDMDL